MLIDIPVAQNAPIAPVEVASGVKVHGKPLERKQQPAGFQVLIETPPFLRGPHGAFGKVVTEGMGLAQAVVPIRDHLDEPLDKLQAPVIVEIQRAVDRLAWAKLARLMQPAEIGEVPVEFKGIQTVSVEQVTGHALNITRVRGHVEIRPMPTICAVNGHAFGAGFMIALCHDERIMREDRGFLCANEMELGMTIPEPELALFRHKMPMPAFFQTVQFARRWGGPDALAAGIVQQVTDQTSNLPRAIERAQSLAHLAKNRTNFKWMKEHIYSENASINGVHGPAYMLRNSGQYAHQP